MSVKLLLAGATALVLLTAHMLLAGLAFKHLAPLVSRLRRRRPTPRS